MHIHTMGEHSYVMYAMCISQTVHICCWCYYCCNTICLCKLMDLYILFSFLFFFLPQQGLIDLFILHKKLLNESIPGMVFQQRPRLLLAFCSLSVGDEFQPLHSSFRQEEGRRWWRNPSVMRTLLKDLS